MNPNNLFTNNPTVMPKTTLPDPTEPQLRALAHATDARSGEEPLLEEWRPGEPATDEAPTAETTEPNEAAPVTAEAPAPADPAESPLAKAEAESAALRSQLEALTKENLRLARLTSIAGSPPVKPSRESGTELTERDLRRLAREADAEGGF